MSDDELEQVIRKRRRLKELRRAKERVRQLERELRGEPAKPEVSTWVPEFLRMQASSGPENLASRPNLLRDEERSRALPTTNSCEIREPSINGAQWRSPRATAC
jgi:hypothetical protein